ncbi:ribonuclease domain-containing protein [Streptomyces sp. NPDC051567]|uniref:ribonuclease domain-containing protein n=1 Tax=Streptomyces sp. NPDC051567 TaxID=3365660 RepID=UPI00379A2C73
MLAGKTPVLVHNSSPSPQGQSPCGVPTSATDTLNHVDQHGVAPSTHGLPRWQGRNRPFANDGRGGGQVLPRTDGQGGAVTYTEYDVNPHMPGVNRGGERLVTGTDGSAWYTNDHYQNFTKIR